MKKLKLLGLVIACLLATGLLSGCGEKAPETDTGAETSPPATEEQVSTYPVTIENNDTTLTYEAAPERVVVLNYDAAEIMSALGLEDRVIQLAPADNTLDVVKQEYRSAISKMPLFDEGSINYGVPGLEAILDSNPDFVYGTVYSFMAQNCGEKEDYINNGINIYASESTCVEKPTLENLYNEIITIGEIFDVRERAEEIVAGFREREAAVADAVADSETIPIFVYDYNQGDGTILTTGGSTIEDYLISLAGGKNIFDDLGKRYGSVSAEEIINRNPEYVIVTDYATDVDGQAKADSMKSASEYAEVPAVKDNKFLIVSGMLVWPNMQTLDGLETIAKALHPECF
jgi:iron complex transport system substrate-binding protein